MVLLAFFALADAGSIVPVAHIMAIPAGQNNRCRQGTAEKIDGAWAIQPV